MSDNNNNNDIKDMTAPTESIQNVGVIGLGRMGTEIANNVIKSGFNLVVYNRTADKTRALAEAGAIVTASPKEAAAKSDIIITSLRDDAALLEVVNGENGMLSGLRPGTIHVGTSTISPSLSTRLAQLHDVQDSLYLAAPVLLDVKGQVYALAEKSNIDLQLVNEILEMTFAYPGLKQYAKRICTRNFDNVSFDLLSAFKDVQLILQTSSYVRVPLSYTNNIKMSILQQ